MRLVILVLLCYSCNNIQKANDPLSKKKVRTICIQPFSDISREQIDHIFTELKNFHSNIVLLQPVALPAETWYAPRKRYRADRLIHWLEKKTGDTSIIIGLTNKDISTTKNNIQDYGIMGLGFHPGHACVASTFRLNTKKINEQLFKVVIHELGHNYGLDHCAVLHCYMRDARGGNPTDEEKGFCKNCRNVLVAKGWKM